MLFLKKIGKKIALEFGMLQLSFVQEDQKLHLSLRSKVIVFVWDFGTKWPVSFEFELQLKNYFGTHAHKPNPSLYQNFEFFTEIPL